MPITNEEAAVMRRTEAYVRRSTLKFLQGKSGWYTAKEIAKEIGIGYTDNIYIPRDISHLTLADIFATLSDTVPKTDFQKVLDKAESEGDIQCVIDDNGVLYYQTT